MRQHNWNLLDRFQGTSTSGTVSWCGHCIQEMEEFTTVNIWALQKAHATVKDIQYSGSTNSSSLPTRLSPTCSWNCNPPTTLHATPMIKFTKHLWISARWWPQPWTAQFNQQPTTSATDVTDQQLLCAHKENHKVHSKAVYFLDLEKVAEYELRSNLGT